MRLCMPDGAVRGISVESAQTGRKTAYDGRIVSVENPLHIRALREQGAFPANLGGGASASGGYRCGECGFASYFRACGRCGSDCVKEC